ncbi:hypothetical protein ACNJUL_20915, partial [Mycobacterium tuberculosis]
RQWIWAGLQRQFAKLAARPAIALALQVRIAAISISARKRKIADADARPLTRPSAARDRSDRIGRVRHLTALAARNRPQVQCLAVVPPATNHPPLIDRQD